MDNKQSCLRDELMGALIGVARAVEGNEHLISDSTDRIIQEGLSSALTDFDGDLLAALLQRTKDEKRRLVPHCFACAAPCGKNNDYDMQRLRDADEEVRSLKLLLLLGIQGMAVCACRAAALGHTDREVNRFFYQALFAVGEESFRTQELLSIVIKFGKINAQCMALLNK